MRSWPVLALAFVTACGSFSEGNDSPVSSDAGAGTDGGDSSTANDGSVPGEDGGVPADDGGVPLPRGCDLALLCDDFERIEVADPRWSPPELAQGGQLTISTAFHKSGTRSLFVDVPDGTSERRALLEKKVPSGTKRVTSRFSVYAQELPANGGVMLAEMATQDGHVYLMFQSGNLTISGNDFVTSQSAPSKSTPFSTGQWYDVLFDYRIPVGPLKGRLTAIVGSSRLDVDVATGEAGSSIQAFEIGQTYAQATSAIKLYIDDVNLDTGL